MALPKSGGVRKFPARYIHLNIRSLDEVWVNRHAMFVAESISPPRDAVLRGTAVRRLVRKIQAHSGKPADSAIGEEGERRPVSGFLARFLGGVEVAQEAALAAERRDAREELLQTIKGQDAFHGDQGFAVLVAGIAPALGNRGGVKGALKER